MPEGASNRQGLPEPVPVRPAQYKGREPFHNREHRERGKRAHRPFPGCTKAYQELGSDDRDHHQALPFPAVAAKRAVLAVGHVDVARYVRSGP